MVSYKLVYFDARGRAELSRLIMAESGVTFEDKRVSVEEWPKIKQGMFNRFLFNYFLYLDFNCKLIRFYDNKKG